MNEPSPDKPPRRPRYRGKNPRQFHEKYKEHQPEKYGEVVAKVLASGKTPAGTHRPILVDEILEFLAPAPGQVAVDCTLGFGGHATAVLAALQPGGKLIGVDADPLELPKTEARLRGLGHPPESLVVRRMNFAGILGFVLQEAPAGADILLADLGLSSMQIDDPSRGFTFKTDGPLDMRLNPGHGQPASELLSRMTETELALILEQNADEPQAVKLAAMILQTHSKTPMTTTGALASAIANFMQKGRATEERTKETVRRVFQALRIAVNDEFGALDSFLRQLPDCLKPGGRIAILTFHSGEDRRVKQSFKRGLACGDYSSISEEVIRASATERHANPRSTSAKLRFAVRG
ncbi:16S rRNA (cytosine(1402)-N(4))-methyltransferase RsmH [Schlesneria paludicola]|uniref:16S rRNA (cytosine(1402)-N(4))-methyltransferase RsmH n=1 Tax=Schlesneria paludicola TaxID=360056 RepID=UPI00029A7E5E|nr:16S rRNA (cytosine(1402)-N(4))-methyltransferase RsmH [Schlesneria paludicola]